MQSITRRQLLKNGGLALVGSTLTGAIGSSAMAQPATGAQPAGSAAAPPTYAFLNKFPRSMQEYYVRRARAVEKEADARRAALRTKADAERYVADVRERIKQCFGPFPEKTPLNARVTATHERDGYRIENVVFESRPNFPVTANLYVPTGRSSPLPAVLATCGHSDSGKAGRSYQAFAQALARQGYVTLIFDPMGQGERLQHVGADFKPKFGVGTHEHTYVGIRMTLVGENLPTWFAWDGIRCLDYLLSRPEVDPRHVGVTGNSGGGTQATWLCGLDRRLTMAAPSCFVTTLRRNIENEHSQDPEQWPARMLELGLDHSDFLAAMAPRPVMMLGQEKDYFDARGFEETAGRLRNLYRLLGAEQNLGSFLGDDYHGFSRPNREAMYGWFNLHTKVSAGGKEPELKMEGNETLRCTPSGQVAEWSPATEFSLNQAKARALAAARTPLQGEALRQAIVRVLNLPERKDVADYRILQGVRGRDYVKASMAVYAVETEPEMHTVVYRLSDTPLLSRVPRGPRRALLYVSHRSADVELREDAWLRTILGEDKEAAIFACDLRGVGESRPAITTPEMPAAKGGVDYFHAGLGNMFGSPMPGQRTHDVLRMLDWLVSHGHEEVHVVARGAGAIPAAFGSVLHENVTRVSLKHALTSYQAVAETESYRWPLSALVPGILHVLDLPDCYRELAKKGLKQTDPVSAEGIPA